MDTLSPDGVVEEFLDRWRKSDLPGKMPEPTVVAKTMNRYIRLSLALAILAIIAVPSYLLGWRAGTHYGETWPDGYPKSSYAQAITKACPDWDKEGAPYPKQCLVDFAKFIYAASRGPGVEGIAYSSQSAHPQTP